MFTPCKIPLLCLCCYLILNPTIQATITYHTSENNGVVQDKIQRCPRGNVSRGKVLAKMFTVRSSLDCAASCAQHARCAAANICITRHRASAHGTYICDLLDVDGVEAGCGALDRDSSLECFYIWMPQRLKKPPQTTATAHVQSTSADVSSTQHHTVSVTPDSSKTTEDATEQTTSTDMQTTSTEQQTTSTEQQTTSTEQQTSTTEQSTSTTEQSTSTTEQSTSTDHQTSTTDHSSLPPHHTPPPHTTPMHTNYGHHHHSSTHAPAVSTSTHHEHHK